MQLPQEILLFAFNYCPFLFSPSLILMCFLKPCVVFCFVYFVLFYLFKNTAKENVNKFHFTNVKSVASGVSSLNFSTILTSIMPTCCTPSSWNLAWMSSGHLSLSFVSNFVHRQVSAECKKYIFFN